MLQEENGKCEYGRNRPATKERFQSLYQETSRLDFLSNSGGQHHGGS